MKKYTLYDPVYKCRFVLCIGDKEEYNKLREKLGMYSDIEGAEGVTDNAGSAVYMWMPHMDVINIEDIALLVHECYHAMKARLTECGVQDEEAQAYYISFLVASFLSKVDKEQQKSS